MRKNKKSLSLFLAILMIVALLPASVLVATAADLYDVLMQPTTGNFFDAYPLNNAAKAYGDVAIVSDNVYSRLMRYTADPKNAEFLPGLYSDIYYGFSDDGYAWVMNRNRENAIINSNGDYVVEFGKYDSIDEPSDDGFAVAYKGRSYVLLNLKNGAETPIKTTGDVDYFSSGLAVVEDEYVASTGSFNHHYEDVNGKNPFGTKYSYASDFAHGYAGVCTVGEDVYKIIDTSGKTVLTLPDGYWPVYKARVSKDGIFAVSNSTGLEGYMDVNGNWIAPCLYQKAAMFQNGYAVVWDSDWKCGMIAANGGIAIPFGTYDSLSNASSSKLVWAAKGNETSSQNAILSVKTPPAPPRYTITVNADPADGGSVTGGGSYIEDAPVTLTAAYNNGYRFVGWKVNGETVSTSATYEFPAKADQTLTAVFELYVAAKVGDGVYSTVQDAVNIIKVNETIELTDQATVDELGALKAPAIEGTFTITGTNADKVKFSNYTSDGYTYSATVTVNSDSSVTVKVTRTAVSTAPVGGGGGGGASTTTGSVTASNPGTANGTVTANTSTAKKGDTVTVTSKANSGYISAAPTVKDKNGNNVAVVKNANGTWSFIMPEGGVTVTGNYVTPAQMFNDLASNGWYNTPIAYVVENGLMQGGGGGKFNPGDTTTRGMIMTILARQFGVDTTVSSGGSWYQKGMDWAKQAGISDGTDPEGSISREQLATMLYRFAGELKVTGDLSAYPDAGDIHGWASNAMIWAVKAGIIEGSGGKLNPQGNASRAEAAAMLMRFCQYIKK